MWYLFWCIRNWFRNMFCMLESFMPSQKRISQLDRIEQSLEHLHEMQHFLYEAVYELLVSGQDMTRLAQKAAEMKGKTDTLRVAIASVKKPLPQGVT